MFNILLPIYFKSISKWKEAVPLCTYMICATAIIITFLILLFKWLICEQKKELEKNRTDSILNFTGYTPSNKIVSQKVTIYLDGKTLIANSDTSDTSSKNNTQTKTKAEETGNNTSNNNNEAQGV